MPTAAIKGRSFSPPFAKSSGKSTWRSSSAPMSQRALRSCPSDGSSNAPSPGSTAAAAWPRIGSASTERPWRSCAWPQSASCCESSVKKHHDPGQTLREKLAKLEEEVKRLAAIEKALLASPDKQISLTDPDCRSMATSGRGSGMVAYNGQSAVDTTNHVIVAHEVTNVGTDRSQLATMAQAAKA